MEIQNELRRAKIKLGLLNQEGVTWLLFDLVDLIDEHIGEAGIPVSEKEKMNLINRLKKEYQTFIKNNTPSDSKQAKLFKS